MSVPSTCNERHEVLIRPAAPKITWRGMERRQCAAVDACERRRFRANHRTRVGNEATVFFAPTTTCERDVLRKQIKAPAFCLGNYSRIAERCGPTSAQSIHRATSSELSPIVQLSRSTDSPISHREYRLGATWTRRSVYYSHACAVER